MACERFAEALKARALGVALRPDGAAHLAVCSTCQAVLEREERLISAINTAIEEVGTAKPAPDFVPAMRIVLPLTWICRSSLRTPGTSVTTTMSSPLRNTLSGG